MPGIIVTDALNVAPLHAARERVARALCEHDWPHIYWPNMSDTDREPYREKAAAVLAALADSLPGQQP